MDQHLNRDPAEGTLANVAVLLLPLASLLIVLFGGVSDDVKFVIGAMPLVAAALVVVVGRVLGLSLRQSALLAMASTTLCLVADLGGLGLVALGSLIASI